MYIIPVLMCQIILVSGVVLFLSCLNVFIRDVALVLPNILMIILFASPIFLLLIHFRHILECLLNIIRYILIAEDTEMLF